MRPTIPVRFDLPDRPLTMHLEVAASPATREHGLAFRARLESEGMIFSFEAPARYLFTLVDTRVDLDIVFIQPRTDAGDQPGGYVVASVHTGRAGDPGPFVPETPVAVALELPAGTCEASGVAPGTRVSWDDEALHTAGREDRREGGGQGGEPQSGVYSGPLDRRESDRQGSRRGGLTGAADAAVLGRPSSWRTSRCCAPWRHAVARARRQATAATASPSWPSSR